MPKAISLHILKKVLRQKGFFFVSQKGSHAKYCKNGKSKLTEIVPIHEKEVRYGSF